MLDFNSFKQKSPQQRFLFILGLVMFVIYLTLGIALIFFANIASALPTYGRILLGLLLIVYAIIRFFRLINQKED
jgi:uncharacterized membrane protein (DUF485 family)